MSTKAIAFRSVPFGRTKSSCANTRLSSKIKGTVPLRSESRASEERARKTRISRKVSVLISPGFIQNESYAALAGSQLYGWTGTCLGGWPGIELGNFETRCGKQKRGSLLNPSARNYRPSTYLIPRHSPATPSYHAIALASAEASREGLSLATGHSSLKAIS
jgi:hypothetical protein